MIGQLHIRLDSRTSAGKQAGGLPSAVVGSQALSWAHKRWRGLPSAALYHAAATGMGVTWGAPLAQWAYSSGLTLLAWGLLLWSLKTQRVQWAAPDMLRPWRQQHANDSSRMMMDRNGTPHPTPDANTIPP